MFYYLFCFAFLKAKFCIIRVGPSNRQIFFVDIGMLEMFYRFQAWNGDSWSKSEQSRKRSNILVLTRIYILSSMKCPNTLGMSLISVLKLCSFKTNLFTICFKSFNVRFYTNYLLNGLNIASLNLKNLIKPTNKRTCYKILGNSLINSPFRGLLIGA